MALSAFASAIVCARCCGIASVSRMNARAANTAAPSPLAISVIGFDSVRIDVAARSSAPPASVATRPSTTDAAMRASPANSDVPSDMPEKIRIVSVPMSTALPSEPVSPFSPVPSTSRSNAEDSPSILPLRSWPSAFDAAPAASFDASCFARRSSYLSANLPRLIAPAAASASNSFVKFAPRRNASPSVSTILPKSLNRGSRSFTDRPTLSSSARICSVGLMIRRMTPDRLVPARLALIEPSAIAPSAASVCSSETP